MTIQPINGGKGLGVESPMDFRPVTAAAGIMVSPQEKSLSKDLSHVIDQSCGNILSPTSKVPISILKKPGANSRKGLNATIPISTDASNTVI
jgi:hypothetical protein